MRHDKYLGTPTPKNYSSLVRLVDPERGEDREVLISMNDPLRHRGETFYQSGMDKDAVPPRFTQLAVVQNPGWLMPYLSCVMVALGMLIHFGMHLIRFLENQK
jgi:cytochrome c biogenesis protein ResB